MAITAARNAVLVHALARATRVIRPAPSIALKGAALLAGGFVSADARHLDDVDLWVDARDARRAWDALQADGFVPVTAAPSTNFEGIDSVDAPTHQLPMLRSPHGALLELHLASHARGEAGDFDACWAGGRDVALHGVNVRIPSTRHLLEQLCAHVVVHHFGDLRYWPRHVDDLRALVRRDPSLAALRRRPDEVGLSLRVLRGVEHPTSADAWLARLFIGPSPSSSAAWRALGLAGRALRFAVEDPAQMLRVAWPAPAHLQFTGDLVRGRTLRQAHLRRWRRIARRLLPLPPSSR